MYNSVWIFEDNYVRFHVGLMFDHRVIFLLDFPDHHWSGFAREPPAGLPVTGTRERCGSPRLVAIKNAVDASGQRSAFHRQEADRRTPST